MFPEASFCQAVKVTSGNTEDNFNMTHESFYSVEQVDKLVSGVAGKSFIVYLAGTIQKQV